MHNGDGSLYVARSGPDPAVFPDFTDARRRAWWGNLYKDFIADGFAGFWNDMNEPAVFETPDRTHAARQYPQDRKRRFRAA